MRLLLGVAVAGVLESVAFAQTAHAVRGYVRADGTYVAPHYQTNPNATQADNYSALGNVNPYTGAVGTRSPAPAPSYGYVPPPAPAYGQPAAPRRCTSMYGC